MVALPERADSSSLQTMNQQEFDQFLKELTRRQEEVLRLFLEGKEDLAIADNLTRTEGCIRSHFSNIYSKFNLTGDDQREDLIRLFLKIKPEWVSPCRRQEVGISEPESPNGSVPLDSYFYISRGDIESRSYQAIRNTGTLIRIKAPKLIGKTSLISRILAEARKQGEIHTVVINFAKADREILNSLEQFLRWFCFMVGKELKLENQIDRYWDNSSGGSIINCADYFEQYLLPKINCPLVLALDEVDRIFPYTFAPGFFSLLRTSFHEPAKTNPVLGNLRLIIAHSTEVYIKIKATESPFNIGTSVELPEFTPAQVNTLAIRHGLGWGNVQVNDLMDMVGGHPYLVRLAMYEAATRKISLEKILQKASTQEGIYSNHLLELWDTLKKHPKLAEAYKIVITSSNGVELDPMQTRLLSSLGLVNQNGNKVKSRNNLYLQYFRHFL